MEPLYVHLAIWLFPVSKPNIQIQIETPFGKWQFHGSFSKYCELCPYPPSSKTGLFLEAASSSVVRCAPPPFPRALHVLHHKTSVCWVSGASEDRGWIPDHRNARLPSPVLPPQTSFSGNTPSLRCFPREFSPFDLGRIGQNLGRFLSRPRKNLEAVIVGAVMACYNKHI